MRHALTLVPFALLPACGTDTPAAEDSAPVEDVLADAADAEDTLEPDTVLRPETQDVAEVTPLEAEPGVWTWFDQPGSSCSDGSETGFALNVGERDDVLVLFSGGGACWDFNSCFLFATATAGPYRKQEFDAAADRLGAGVADRDDPENPYRGFSYVFVPYCTGDLHAGERVMSYTAGGLTRTWHHTGAVNARLMLARLAATFPRPARLVVAGLSAGGYGATLQYAAFREAFGAEQSQLLDDSGPLLVADGIPADYRAAWFLNWRLDRVVDPICGQDCKQDLSRLYPALSARFPGDRMALVSSLQDKVIATTLQLSGAAFESEIRQLASDALAPLANWRTFLFAGDEHTALGGPAAVKVGETDLRGWLGWMLDGDTAWVSLVP
jgi:hypothetical protein